MMNLFGIEIGRKKSVSGASSVPANRGGWRSILEPFSGAWQRNHTENVMTLNTYPTLYACVSRISSDIGKLPFTLIQYDEWGVSKRIVNPAYSPVLNKPNDYQTQNQFREFWILSKLLKGNTYVLKRKDARGVVNALYILDPDLVTPMVTPSGAVYYQVDYNQTNALGTVTESITIPASEIIHDRIMCLFHPLVGIAPLAASYLPTLKNTKILKRGVSEYGTDRPFGILTVPAGMSDEDAKATEAWWKENYPGIDIAAIGADVKFSALSGKATDSQMVEQMKYSDQQICQPFGIPPFKIGIGTIPAGMGVDDLNLLYYTDALQPLIEHMERLLDEGLRIPNNIGVMLDTEPLLRMDEGKMTDIEVKKVQGMIAKPDEARRRLNYDPTPGGDTLWGQHQDYPLGKLAERDDLNDTKPAEPDEPGAAEPEDELKSLAIRGAVMKRMEALYNEA